MTQNAYRKPDIGKPERIMENVVERKIRTFEDLEVWQFCRTLRIKGLLPNEWVKNQQKYNKHISGSGFSV
jgi:hypothetical protein